MQKSQVAMHLSTSSSHISRLLGGLLWRDEDQISSGLGRGGMGGSGNGPEIRRKRIRKRWYSLVGEGVGEAKLYTETKPRPNAEIQLQHKGLLIGLCGIICACQ